MAEPSSRPLFSPTYRLLLYCVLAGALGGVAALLFDAAVDFAQEQMLGRVGGYTPPGLQVAQEEPVPPPWHDRWRLPLITTLGGLLSGLLVYRFAPEAEGHGTDAAISSYHQQAGRVRRRVPLIKLVSSALTIGSGGVAGREGPTAQISVGIATALGDVLQLKGQERRHLLLAGMAAGLAAMFRAPLGMAIFAVEILYSGMAFEAEALIYTVVASVTAYATFGFFAGWSRLFDIPLGMAFDSPATLVGFVLLGLAAGAFGAGLPTLLYRLRDLLVKLPGPPHIRPAFGGLLVGLIAMAVPGVLGTGYGWVELAMFERLPLTLLVALLLLKGPAMSLTIGSGGSGGVFAPTVTIGALLGAVVGKLMASAGLAGGMPIAGFVVVGMASVFAGAARTPISTLIMVVEMTGGYGLIVPAMLANVIAFVVQRSLTEGARYPTLYHSQVERPSDSPLHRGVSVRRAVEMIDQGSLDADELRLPRLVSLLQYGEPISVGHGSAVLAALEIDRGSQLEGGTVADTVGRMDKVTAVAVLRGSEMLVPRGATELHGGDQLFVVATPPALATLRLSATAVPGSAAHPAETEADAEQRAGP